MFGSVPPSKSSKKSEPPTAIPKTETATCHNLRGRPQTRTESMSHQGTWRLVPPLTFSRP